MQNKPRRAPQPIARRAPQPAGHQPAPPGGSQFEFSPAHEAIFAQTALWITIVLVAMLLLIAGTLYASLSADEPSPAGLITAIGLFLIAVPLLVARGAMRRVVTQRGRDISHAMDALLGLRLCFTIQAVAFVLLGAVALVSAFMSLTDGPFFWL